MPKLQMTRMLGLVLYFTLTLAIALSANASNVPLGDDGFLQNDQKSHVQRPRITKADLKLLRKVYQEKFPASEPITIDRGTHGATYLDPECSSVHLVHRHQTSYDLRMRTRGQGCSYTLRNVDGGQMNIVCAGLSPSGRELEGALCKGKDILVRQDNDTEIFCGDHRLLVLGKEEMRSEMQFVNCAIIFEDNPEERRHGAIPSDEYHFVPQPCPRTCGVSAYQPPEQQTRIIGGEAARPGEFPWQAFIYSLGFQEGGSLCGGSLINSRYVLSAAHCFKQGQFTAVKQVAVVLGLHRFSDLEDNPYTQVMRGAKIIVHPGFDINTMLNDLSLVLLHADVVWSPSISPICLSSPYSDYDYSPCLVSGFGLVQYDEESPDDSKLPKVLQKANLDILPPASCRMSFTLFGVVVDDVAQVCTKGFRQDSCKGDSGGPIVVKNEAGRFEQVGIVSWGIGCNDQLLPSVNTRVSSYREWIVRTASSAKSATCG